jgi:hypothetical protein
VAAPSRIALSESADNLGPSVASQLFDLIIALLVATCRSLEVNGDAWPEAA